MAVQIISLSIIVLLLLALLKLGKSMFFKKKVTVVEPDLFRKEVNENKNLSNKVLVVFENGYWEIKEENHTTEWSGTAGTQTYIDFDTDVDDTRYTALMNTIVERNEEGHHSIAVAKEIELKSTIDIEALLQLKI